MKFRRGPRGVHLFDRSTGANVLLDEIQVEPGAWSRAPRSISIAITNACDLRCPYCYAPKDAATLSSDRLLPWLEELDAHGCLGVGFGGGEPTLSRQLPFLCHYLTAKTGMAVSLTTHGHWANKQLALELRGNVNFVRVSMDGVGSTYEKLRGQEFARFIRQLQTIRSVGRFGINYVVNASTLPELDLAINVARDNGAVEFLLLLEQPVRGKGGIDRQTLNEIRSWLDEYDGTLPLAISEAGAAALSLCDPLGAESGLRSYAHIDARGTLKRSSYDASGVVIDSDGVLKALQLLSENKEAIQ